jgi:2-succinyl-5-enolpyruvyl-6-hydroxy-3-cyclohexene-1-carboxylate synthase
VGVVVTDADRQFAAAWSVVDELARFGMEHACVSPGSRSTPIALALSRHPRVRVHVHLDERAAAFFAVGIAKATARPVGVACTSGTAVANMLPAVVEASMSRTPLVLLTADRPPELQGVGANQTIEQRGIFGGFVRASFQLPLGEGAPDPAAWRAPIEAAWFALLGPPPGPVQVNLPFREPLVPDAGAVASIGPTEPGGPTGHVGGVEPEQIEGLRRELTSTERGLVLAGTMREGPADLVEVARRVSWPLLAEPTSSLRVPGTLAAGQHLLADEAFAAAHVPDVVVQFGAAPTSRAGLELVRRAHRLVIVDPDHVVGDPHGRAAWSLRAEGWVVALELLDALPGKDADTPWVRRWREADAVARRVVDALLDTWDEPFEGRIARDVAAGAPEGSTLVIGSSMPVRDLDAFMAPREGVRVLANRGASGIDGFVATALGVAATGVTTTALCGDLTLLHDVGALVWTARRGPDAVFVVPNNDGGAIFSFLPQRELPELRELFTTPHGLDLGAVCAAAGASHARVTRAGDLLPAIDDARARGGVHVVELPVEREDNVRRHGEVRAAVAAALERT